MQKRIAILAPSHSELEASFHKPTSKLNPAVDNLGNLMFRYATSMHVRDFEYIDDSMAPEMIREKFDVIVMPLANLLHPWATSWENWAMHTRKFIEECGLPLVPVGMGSQALSGQQDPNIGLPEFICDLARCIADHSITIGLRGSFTAEVLDAIGVRNVVVTGCPSNFISPNMTLGRDIESRSAVEFPQRLCVSGNDFYVSRTGVEQDAQRKLLDYVELHDAFYLVQAPEELVALTRRDHLSHLGQSRLEELRRYLRPSYVSSRFNELVRKRFLSIPALESWLEFSAGCDLYIGMRIHGAMAAIQAGTLPICITHDRRTEELCETMSIPSIAISEFVQKSDLFDVVEHVKFDGAAYDARRIQLAHIYREIYAANGIPCHLPLDIDAEKKPAVVHS
ncbi:polysaccharide pyruvyl transferase family protein [Massilia sp. NP310]|uniref:polysaccharide pyruvyl transferase family protein n=1 Tax=Massilia sp. NP310 TaxID=2861282 RepID=UPI001C63165E|nr:polysaccharide pyruvyl transferase family protein [Massilia sp. NP310]QYG04239.1 polysaccharide pyruvyl transferase family protein [Massilia sp. NP310]